MNLETWDFQFQKKYLQRLEKICEELKMNIKMIFLDMDGTLLDDDKNLPKVNREAIKTALQNK